MRSLTRILIPVLLATLTAALYLPRLDQSPPSLSNDEACIAINARAIAATGRDVYGARMPLLFHSPPYFKGTPIWFLPILVYATAIILKVLPFTETTIRLPLVLAAIADVLLMYYIGRRITGRTMIAVVVAALLALTPSHLFHARVALPAQISVPFVLGWLLCVLIYLERRRATWLVASGALLGVAAVGYIGPLALAYGLLTWIALAQVRARAPHFVAVVIGGVVPCVYFLALMRDPSAVREIFGHYQQAPAAASSLVHRASEVVSLYFSFWNPDFLFVQGAVRDARAAGAIGVFLLPLAGLVLLGIVSALRRRDPIATLVLGGFLAAPLAASFVDEAHAIWRALLVPPFGVLLATLGLDWLMSDEGSTVRRWAVYLAALGGPVAVAVVYGDHLPHASPMIRALVVPLAVVLLASLVRKLPASAPSARSVAIVAIAVVLAEAAFTRLGGILSVLIPLLGILALWLVEDEAAILVIASLLIAEVLYLHVDYPTVSRIGVIPASAIVMAMRLATAAVVISVAGVTLAKRTKDPDSSRPQTIALVAAVVVVQLAYFHLDRFGLRLIATSAILVVAAAACTALAAARRYQHLVACLCMATLLGAAFIQFGYFYTDYLTGYPTRNIVSSGGNVRAAWEHVIDEAGRRPMPAVFIGPIGTYHDGGLYWRFYLMKHDREELIARTTEDDVFDATRVRRLPAGSAVLVGPSPQVDRTVEQMRNAGEVRPDAGDGLLRAPDGTPLLWILERR